MITALPQFTMLAVFAFRAATFAAAFYFVYELIFSYAQDLLAGALPQLVFHLASKRH